MKVQKQVMLVIAAGALALGVCQYGAVMHSRAQEDKPQVVVYVADSKDWESSSLNYIPADEAEFQEESDFENTESCSESSSEESEQPQEEDTMPIVTKSNSIAAATAVRDAYAGTIKCEKWGLECPVYYTGPIDYPDISLSQAHIDAKNSADLIGQPFGLKGGSLLGDHNVHTGRYFGNAQEGDRIYVTTPYGEFIYEVARCGYGSVNYNFWYFMCDDNTGEGITDSGHDLVLYTCYPFDAWETDQRWFVYADLVDGTVLS